MYNDWEHEKMAVNSIVMERTLREMYLMTLQMAVRDASPTNFITSYNKVNGVYVSEDLKMIRQF